MWRPAERISDGTHRLAEPVGRVVAKTRVPPNLVTIFGFLINIGVAWMISRGPSLFTIAGALIVVAGIFDLLDGAVARGTNRVTKFGALLDSTLDRLSEAALLFGLLVYLLGTGQSPVLGVVLVNAALVGSLLVSYVRARAEGLGLSCQVGLFTRAERVIILALGLISGQVIIALWVLAVLSLLTVAQRLLFIWQQTRREVPGGPGG